MSKATPTPDYPVCRECRHCHLTTTDLAAGIATYDCAHPKVMTLDIVTGVRGMLDCADQRKSDDTLCGMEGRLWEPKVPFWITALRWMGMSQD